MDWYEEGELKPLLKKNRWKSFDYYKGKPLRKKMRNYILDKP